MPSHPASTPRNPDALPVADHVLLADQVASNRADATPPIASFPFSLGWPPERVRAALEAGIAAGTLRAWPAGPDGPSVTLSSGEAESRKLRIWPTKARRGSGEFAFRWESITKPDPVRRKSVRVATKSKVILDADLEAGEDHVGGRGKSKAGKPRLSSLARIAGSTQAYLEVIEDFEAGRAQTRGPRGQEILGAAMGYGAGLLGMGAPWPHEDLRRSDGACPQSHDPGVGTACPYCGGNEIRQPMYCMWCDRTGVDRWVRHASPLPAGDPPRRGPDKRPRQRRACDEDVT